MAANSDFVKALKSVDFPTLGNPTIPTGRYILQKQCSAEDAFLLKKDNWWNMEWGIGCDESSDRKPQSMYTHHPFKQTGKNREKANTLKLYKENVYIQNDDR